MRRRVFAQRLSTNLCIAGAGCVGPHHRTPSGSRLPAHAGAGWSAVCVYMSVSVSVSVSVSLSVSLSCDVSCRELTLSHYSRSPRKTFAFFRLRRARPAPRQNPDDRFDRCVFASLRRRPRFACCVNRACARELCCKILYENTHSQRHRASRKRLCGEPTQPRESRDKISQETRL